MAGLSLLGYGFSTIVSFIAIVVIAGVVWRGRTNYVSGTQIVLQRFRINEDPSARVAVEIVGRASGIVSWVLTLLRLDPAIELVVTDSEAIIKMASLSGIKHTYIPLGQITATVCGYQRSVLALAFAALFSVSFVMNLLSGFLSGNRGDIGSDMGSAFGALILAAIAALVYFLSKRISIGMESMHTHGLVFKRSVIENVSVDLPEALRAISVINARVLAAQGSQALSGKGISHQPSSPVRSTPAVGETGRCTQCSAVNPIGTKFCENCGSTLRG